MKFTEVWLLGGELHFAIGRVSGLRIDAFTMLYRSLELTRRACLFAEGRAYGYVLLVRHLRAASPEADSCLETETARQTAIEDGPQKGR